MDQFFLTLDIVSFETTLFLAPPADITSSVVKSTSYYISYLEYLVIMACAIEKIG